jgi:hypothetical protein
MEWRRKKALLFEKRSKNFCTLVRAWRQRECCETNVFWFFFSKKNGLLSFFEPCPFAADCGAA